MTFGISREVLAPVTRLSRIALPYVLAAAGLSTAVYGVYRIVPSLRPIHVEIVTVHTPAIEPAIIQMPSAPVVVQLAPEPVAPAPTEPPPAGPELAAPIDPDGFHFVFSAGGSTYMKLADGQTVARYGKVTVFDQGETSASAPVADDDVPAEYQTWLGREVVINAGCHATVERLAVVARLVGDPAYYGDADAWTAETIFAAGAVVLAAELSGCDGPRDRGENGTYARDAKRAGILAPVAQKNGAAAQKARADFFSSELARAAQDEWTGAARDGRWSRDAMIDVRTVRHPTTGATWVLIHATDTSGCGGPDINILGLYSVDDGGGVHRASLSKVENFSKVSQLVDVDRDGNLEVIGYDWVGLSKSLRTFDGKTVATLELPFYGCPC